MIFLSAPNLLFICLKKQKNITKFASRNKRK